MHDMMQKGLKFDGYIQFVFRRPIRDMETLLYPSWQVSRGVDQNMCYHSRTDH